MPRKETYKLKDEDTRTPVVANNTSSTRFKEIKRFFHHADKKL